MVGDVGLEPTMGTPRVSKTRAYTNSANRPNRLHHLVLEPFYSVTSFVTFWGGGYSHPPMYENKLKLSNLVARGRFELPHEWFKAICLTAWLPGNMVELTGVEPVSKKSLLTTNLILTLQVLCIPFYLYSLPYTNLKSKF